MRPRAGLRSAVIRSSRETIRQAIQNERFTTLPFDSYRDRGTPEARKLDRRDARSKGRLLPPGPAWGAAEGRLHPLQARALLVRSATDPLDDESLPICRQAAK